MVMDDIRGGDPFLTKPGRGPVKRPQRPLDGGGMEYGTMLLMVIPWIIFTAVTCSFAFSYHHYPQIVFMVSAGCIAMSGIYFSMSGRYEGRWYMFLAGLILMATVFGVLVGYLTYHEYFLQFYAYDENRAYTNVLPSEPAAAHADAGKIDFSQSSRIDTTKAVGYKQGDVYCVAPVMDEMQTSRVEYWAAGVNCCSQRSTFDCNDAGDVNARSGVVILDTNSWFGWFPSDRDKYEKAVKQAEAAFDIVSAPNPLFIKWVTDPKAVQDDFYKNGISVLLAGTFVYLLLSILFGFTASSTSRRQANASR